MSKRSLIPAVVLILTIAGFFVRIYRLDAVPLRGDEAFTVQNWMSLPLTESLSRIAVIEPHPFLNYVVFRLWGLLAGTSEFAARFLPAVVNTLGTPVLYALGSWLFNRRVGVLSAFLWAFHPYLIWHSQDARNYAVWVTLSALALWLALRVLRLNRRIDWVLYVSVAVLAANIFYFELFAVFALTVYVLVMYRDNRSLLIRWLLAQALIVGGAVLSFVALQGALIAGGGYGGTLGDGLNIPRLFTWFIPALLLGEAQPQLFSDLSLWLFMLGLLLAGLVISWRFNRPAGFLLLCMGFLPLLLLSVVSLYFDIFAPRYVLTVVPVYLLLVAVFCLYVPARAFVRGGLLLLWLVLGGLAIGLYFGVNDYAKSKDWPGVSAYLESQAIPADLVIQLAADAAFGFYYRASAPEIALPESPAQTPDAIRQRLDDALARYNSLWLVGHTFPDWPNAGVVENYLQDSAQRTRSTTVAGLSIQQYMPWDVRADEITRSSLAVFGGAVELAGVRVFLPPEPTGEITVWLYWRALDTTPSPYKVFLHLQGQINPATGTPLWTQDDRFPQNGRISTDDWALAAIYRDVYLLPVPPDLPVGEYELRIGLYDPQTGGRLPLREGSDSYRIQTVTLP